MKRRDFLSSALVGGAALAACGGSSTPASDGSGPAVSTGKRIRWRLASSFPRSLDTLYGTCEVMAERVKAMTDGQFDIRCYPAGELVPGLQVLDAAQQGTVQIGQSASYYYIGKNPALAFDTCVPFGLTARQQNAWLMEAGGQALIQDLLNDFGVMGIPGGNTGVQMGGWFNKKINTLEDLKGLTIRMPGLGGEVLRRMGATAVTLPGGEIYPSLKSGAIDATEWVGPWNDMAFGFHKVAKYYYYPGFQEPGPAICCGFNLKVWNSLTSDQKAIVKAAAAAENSYTLAEYNAKNAITLEVMKTKHKIKLRKFSDEIMQGIGNASGQVIADAAKSDAMTAKVAKSYLDFRKKMIAWSKTADHAYANARLLPFKYGG